MSTTTAQGATAGQISGVPRAAGEAAALPRARRRRRVLRPILMIGGIAAVAVGSVFYWLHSGRYVSIDDSYVQADRLMVSTDVSGLVATVAVHDNQQVHKGEVLFTLDERQFRIALEGAQANLQQTVLNITAMKRDYQRMLHDTDARQAQVQADQASFDRFAGLIKGGGVTRAEYDDARFKLAADQQAVEGLKTRAQVQLAKLAGNADIAPAATPEYKLAAAQMDEARRQLDDTVVRAPYDGVVFQASALQPGQYLRAGTAAFGMVSSDNLWVESNPKETEITWVKDGDPVELAVDSYPDRLWHGTVQSIAPNSGSEFSVLPAQNSSGNWVKVVQRMQLRIHVDQAPGDPPLRAGMSVVVSIDTGHKRQLKDLW